MLHLDEETHTYRLDGHPLPSPSSVFQDLGLVDSRWYKTEDRARGRAVHAGLNYALKGTLDWSTLHPDLHGYVRSGLLWIERCRPVVRRMETSLYHPIHRFAGTFDVEWELDGWFWIVDFKSGKAPRVTKYQTAAYAMMASNPGTTRPHKRAALELQEDGSMANLITYDDHTDGAGWLNLLGAYRIRQSLHKPNLASGQPGE